MRTRIRSVVVQSIDPASLTRFWSALLEQPITDDSTVRLSEDVDLRFDRTDQPKRVKNRLHLDLASTSAEHQVALVNNARELGAFPVDIGQEAVPWVVLADPEGNEFCVLEPRDEYLGIGPVAAVVVDALNPPELARFWSHLTGLPITRDHDEYASLRQESGFWLEFVRVHEPKTVPNRVHLELADPEGNEFQVL